MDNNYLKKLTRKEILEILIEQIKENERLEEELQKANEELKKREIIYKEAGSLAEASLKLVDIFKKADEAANIYLNNIKGENS